MIYAIHDATEETYCDHCGRPLLAGDRAYMSDDERLVACSDTCLRAAKQTMSERPLDDRTELSLTQSFDFTAFY